MNTGFGAWILIHLQLLGSGALLVFLLEEDGVDVGENTTRCNGSSAKVLVQLFVVLDSKLDVTRSDAGLLVVTGSVAGKLKKFRNQVFKDGGHVHGGTSAHTLRVATLLQKTAQATNWERQTSLGGTAFRPTGLLATSSLAFAGHVEKFRKYLEPKF